MFYLVVYDNGGRVLTEQNIATNVTMSDVRARLDRLYHDKLPASPEVIQLCDAQTGDPLISALAGDVDDLPGWTIYHEGFQGRDPVPAVADVEFSAVDITIIMIIIRSYLEALS